MKNCYVGLILQTKHRADEAKVMADGLKELMQKKQCSLSSLENLCLSIFFFVCFAHPPLFL